MAFVNVQVIIDGVDCGKHRQRKKLRLFWAIGPVTEQKLSGPAVGESVMFKLTDSQQVAVSISAADKKGQSAPVEGVTFATSDPNVATVVQDAVDPSKALVVAGLPGTCQIQVSADADLGEGVTKIEGVLDVEVVAGQAVALSVATGVAEEQP